MSRKRKREEFMWGNLPDDIWEQIAPWIFLLKKNEKFVTSMRNFRSLLLTSKTFLKLFNTDYYWLLCACHLPNSYKLHLKPFISRERIYELYKGPGIMNYYESHFMIENDYKEMIKKNPDKIIILKQLLIQKYKLYLLETKTNGLERRLLKK